MNWVKEGFFAFSSAVDIFVNLSICSSRNLRRFRQFGLMAGNKISAPHPLPSNPPQDLMGHCVPFAKNLSSVCRDISELVFSWFYDILDRAEIVLENLLNNISCFRWWGRLKMSQLTLRFSVVEKNDRGQEVELVRKALQFKPQVRN